MSYGYEPPKQEQQGSWSEIAALTKAAFIAIGLPLLGIGATLALTLTALVALFTNPLLALIPLSILGVGVAYLVRRDRRTQETLDAEIHGPRTPGRPGGGPRAPR